MYIYVSILLILIYLPLQKGGNILDFCEAGLKISGTSPLRVRAALEMDGISATAIQATTTGNHTVAFIGTSRGYIKKVCKHVFFFVYWISAGNQLFY